MSKLQKMQLWTELQVLGQSPFHTPGLATMRSTVAAGRCDWRSYRESVLAINRSEASGDAALEFRPER
ncbi:MAG: hypothetical protein WKF77_29240 [Planctomycetaceae bacterium]